MIVFRLTPLRETSPASNFAPRGAFDRGGPAPGDRLWHRVERLPPGLGQLAFPSLRSTALVRRKRAGRARGPLGPLAALFYASDPQTGGAPVKIRGRNVRSKDQCSMCPAIHTKSRSWLRSSSTLEPSDPPLGVVFCFWFLSDSKV